MTDSILQSFLDNRFIKTDIPENITNLEKAVAEVQKLLNKRKTKIIGYTLVALDPTISDDPIVTEVEAIIIKQWPAFKNSVVKTKDTPIVYIQAVILEALNKLSTQGNLAAIIWHTGCKIISYYKLAGQQKILTNFLLEIGKQVEEIGRKNWSIIENTKIEPLNLFELNLPKVGQGKISQDEFQKHLMAAAVFTGWAGQTAGIGENPAHQTQGNHVWPKFFAERAALGLSQEINSALTTQDNSIVAISTSIKQSIDSYFSNLKPYMDQVSSSMFQSCQSLIKRNDLIWWKQALYSPRLNSSYRALSPLPLVMAMARDLADTVPPIHPQSVIFFLKETLRDVLGEKSETEDTIAQILAQLQKLTNTEKQLLDDLTHENEGRTSLGACLVNIIKESLSAEGLFKLTGLERNAKISFSELCVWLFHDLQAAKIAKEK